MQLLIFFQPFLAKNNPCTFYPYHFILFSIIGHKDTSITQTTYAHVVEELRQKNKKRVGNLLANIYEV